MPLKNTYTAFIASKETSLHCRLNALMPILMEIRSKFFVFLFVLSLALILMVNEVNGCEKSSADPRDGVHTTKLFVFGDSYADTGNLGKIEFFMRSWYPPYGDTFPKHPTGRFSDGRVLTDYIASYLGIKSPIPYKYRKYGYKLLPYGMNFAVGGSGVFNTGNFQRNLSSQINTFEGQIKDHVFNKCDLNDSVALVVISGNDFDYFGESGGVFNSTPWQPEKLIVSMIDGLAVDMKRLRSLGVGKLVLTNLHPLDYTPFVTREFKYQKNNQSIADAVMYYNSLLGLFEANNPTYGYLGVHILDIHSPFTSIINQAPGARKFKNGLKPCCEGVTPEASCGQLNEKFVKQYTMCCNASDAFYWDSVHPTQAAWAAVYELIKPQLAKIFS